MRKQIFRNLCLAVIAAVLLPCYAACGGSGSPSDTTRVFRFHFQFDSSAFLRDYKDNASGLDAIGQIASDDEAMSRLRSITVTGAASPDNVPEHNAEVAFNRAYEVGGFLGWKYPDFKAVGIERHSIGEDWNGLIELVENAAGLPMRAEVLRILHSGASSDQKVIRLRALDNGRVYTYMQRNLLPELRYAEVVMRFWSSEVSAGTSGNNATTSATGLSQQQPESSNCGSDADRTSNVTGVSSGSETPESTTSSAQATTSPTTQPSSVASTADRSIGKTPREVVGYRFAVKTNLVEWAGVFPDFSGLRGGVNFYGISPNLEAEWFISNRWSLSAAGSWTTGFRIGSDNLTERWGYSSVSVEPRLWFNARRANTGFFAGVYGSVGQYNMLFEGMELAPSGDLYSAGLSIGYAAMLGKHFMIEAGVRGGYAYADNFFFPTEPYDSRYKVSSGSVNGLRLQSFKVSIGYRFGKK